MCKTFLGVLGVAFLSLSPIVLVAAGDDESGKNKKTIIVQVDGPGSSIAPAAVTGSLAC